MVTEAVKKTVAGTILVCIALRLAVVAGAGEALADWVRDVGAESGFFEQLPDSAPAQPEPQHLPEADADGKPSALVSDWLLVEVTPPPAAEEADSRGERGENAAVAADLSADITVNNRTAFDVDFAALAAEGPGLTLQRGEPQVLIFHTHSSEAYTPDDIDRYEESDPYRTEDKSYNVVRIGDVLTEKLESYGLSVIHDREIYDYPSYTGSYGRSGAAVERYLAEYPSIQIVIDLHRDALGSGDIVYKTQALLSGKTSAQVMMLVGTGENGLWHPNWQQNLKLVLFLQQALEKRYPGLARPIELVSERYNQQLSPGMLILEVGSSGNTLREAITAIELFGEAAGAALAEKLS